MDYLVGKKNKVSISKAFFADDIGKIGGIATSNQDVVGRFGSNSEKYTQFTFQKKGEDYYLDSLQEQTLAQALEGEMFTADIATLNAAWSSYGPVHFPLADYGKLNGGTTYNWADLRPFYNVNWVMKKIFSSVGMIYSCPILESGAYNRAYLYELSDTFYRINSPCTATPYQRISNVRAPMSTAQFIDAVWSEAPGGPPPGGLIPIPRRWYQFPLGPTEPDFTVESIVRITVDITLEITDPSTVLDQVFFHAIEFPKTGPSLAVPRKTTDRIKFTRVTGNVIRCRGTIVTDVQPGNTLVFGINRGDLTINSGRPVWDFLHISSTVNICFNTFKGIQAGDSIPISQTVNDVSSLDVVRGIMQAFGLAATINGSRINFFAPLSGKAVVIEPKQWTVNRNKDKETLRDWRNGDAYSGQFPRIERRERPKKPKLSEKYTLSENSRYVQTLEGPIRNIVAGPNNRAPVLIRLFKEDANEVNLDVKPRIVMIENSYNGTDRSGGLLPVSVLGTQRNVYPLAYMGGHPFQSQLPDPIADLSLAEGSPFSNLAGLITSAGECQFKTTKNIEAGNIAHLIGAGVSVFITEVITTEFDSFKTCKGLLCR